MVFVIDSFFFLCANAAAYGCEIVSVFTQSSSLFEYCLAGKLDYLQDKRKHVLATLSPTSDCCSHAHNQYSALCSYAHGTQFPHIELRHRSI